MDNTFFIKDTEMDFEYLCKMEYKRVLLLMTRIEEEFGVNLRDEKNKQLRHEFLDVANFIKKLPEKELKE